MRRVWLASYPKSGNTWLRILFANIFSTSDEPVGINSLIRTDGIASAREPLERLLLIDSGLHTHDEIDVLRPSLYAWRTANAAEDEDRTSPVNFVKVHDAYLSTPDGEPLLAGRRGADGAILIVRDPRDVAPSLANHMGSTIDEAIDFMGNADAVFGGKTSGQSLQFRQRLPTWSGHAASWLDQRDIPVHLVRYEDLKCDPVRSLWSALEFVGCPVTDEKIAQAVGFSDFRPASPTGTRTRIRRIAQTARGIALLPPGRGWRLAQRTDVRSERAHRAHAVLHDGPPGLSAGRAIATTSGDTACWFVKRMAG
jgi:aryl sulfotransferase